MTEFEALGKSVSELTRMENNHVLLNSANFVLANESCSNRFEQDIEF